MSADGSQRRVLAPQVSRAGLPEWSPDGSRLAFTSILSPTSSELFVISADGSGLRRIARGPNPGSPRWSPDATRLLFLNGTGTRRYLQLVDLRSGVSRRVVDRVHNSTPGWSPDGARISYVRQRRLFIASANGARQRRLSELVVWGASAWSHDGSRILFESRRGPGSRADVWSVAPDGTGLRRLTRGSEQYAEDADPAWSPDGAEIAFVSDRGRPPNARSRGLFVMNADGSCETVITSSVELGPPAWRPRWPAGAPLQCVDLFVEAAFGVEAHRVTRDDDRVYFYEVEVVNEGTEPATAVELRAEPRRPDEVTFVAVEGAACVVAEAVSCTLGVIAAGETRRVVVRFRARPRPRSDPIAITFNVRGAERDVEPFGNGTTPLRYVPHCRWTDVREQSVAAPPYGGRNLVCGTDRPDRIAGSGENETILGARGNDRLFGAAGFETIAGENGHDHLRGGRGRDVVSGGSGDDRLHGGPGRDLLSGGTGSDVIAARDGVRDEIYCDRGRDRVLADRVDAVKGDCERVLR